MATKTYVLLRPKQHSEADNDRCEKHFWQALPQLLSFSNQSIVKVSQVQIPVARFRANFFTQFTIILSARQFVFGLVSVSQSQHDVTY